MDAVTLMSRGRVAATAEAGGWGEPHETRVRVPSAYPNLLYFHEVDRGGHFAPWEEPDLFAAELRAAIKPLRTVR